MAGGKNGCDLLKIILMIRFGDKSCLGANAGAPGPETFMMSRWRDAFVLGPTVGKINVNRTAE